MEDSNLTIEDAVLNYIKKDVVLISDIVCERCVFYSQDQGCDFGFCYNPKIDNKVESSDFCSGGQWVCRNFTEGRPTMYNYASLYNKFLLEESSDKESDRIKEKISSSSTFDDVNCLNCIFSVLIESDSEVEWEDSIHKCNLVSKLDETQGFCYCSEGIWIFDDGISIPTLYRYKFIYGKLYDISYQES